MTTVTLEEIQRDLLMYLHRVAAGETLLVVHAEMPVAEIIPASRTAEGHQLRPIGLCAGDFVVPDNFDAPLSDDILDAFEGR